MMSEKKQSEKESKEIQSIETLDLGGAGMICGPVNEGKEDKK